MKKLLTLTLALWSVGLHGATFEWDMVKGIDITAQSSITAAQLNQLIDGATPYPGKGLVIRQPIHPNVTTNPRYTNFLWFDLVTQTLKSYQGVGDDATNWVTATLGIGTIGTVNLAGGAVTDAKLAANAVNTTNLQNNSVTSDKIAAGNVGASQLAAASVTNAALAPLAVSGDKIAYQTILNTNLAELNITGGKLQTATITGDKIANGTITSVNLATNLIGSTNIAAGAVGNAQLGTNAVNTNNISVSGGSAYQFLQVDPSATFIRWNSPFFTTHTQINMGSLVTGTRGITNSHGLGGAPLLVRCVLVNVTPDSGYNAGDVVEFNGKDDGSTMATVSSDASNVYAVFGGLPTIASRAATVGTRTGITTGSWTLRVDLYR